MRQSVCLLLCSLLLLARRSLADDAQGLPVKGRLVVPEDASLDNAEVVLQLSSGKRLLAFVLRDGGFSFSQVPRGVHTLSVQLSGLLYPTVKLDVGTVAEGKVAASAADVPGGLPLSYPLLLRPFSRIEYFEKRQGFNLWAFLKTPYGMMAAFMLFSIFIMPRLKIDPEEYKEMMGQRDGGDDAPPAIAAAGAQQQGRRRSD